MQSVSSRIWTRVAVSISYDDNDYTTGTMVLDASLLNTQHYRVRIKGKMEQFGNGVVAIEKGAFGSPSTNIANFT